MRLIELMDAPVGTTVTIRGVVWEKGTDGAHPWKAPGRRPVGSQLLAQWLQQEAQEAS